jgi:hypothetical protein
MWLIAAQSFAADWAYASILLYAAKSSSLV